MAETGKRSNWYLITGIIFGVVIGLVISTLIAPAQDRYVTPAGLDAVGKDIYREEVALAYASTGALNRAIDRLMQVGQAQPAPILVAQAQRLQGAGGSERLVEALMTLAEHLSGK